MKNEANFSHLKLDHIVQKQMRDCLILLEEVFGKSLMGVYLYGSSIRGLQKYSDIDLFSVVRRPTTYEEKAVLARALLEISGVYMKGEKRAIEMTIVVQSDVNPWRYPPRFDFQYGDWLRTEFVGGNYEPWTSKEMPDLAVLITQILLDSVTLMGEDPNQLLAAVPYRDFTLAMGESMPELLLTLEDDIRNVLLTMARIWHTVSTDVICSKSVAALWAINQLPELYRPVMERARGIYDGNEREYWDDMNILLRPCVDFMLSEASKTIDENLSSQNLGRSIKLA